MVRKIGYLAIVVIFIFTSSGCATIVHGASTTIRINSVPSGATATVGGKTIITPGRVTLKNNQSYSIIFKKDGYEDTYFTIDRHRSGWVWGNFLLALGAAIGLNIDYETGGAFILVPTNLNAALIAKKEEK